MIHNKNSKQKYVTDMNNNNTNTSKLKRIAAFIGLIIIAAAVIVMIYGMLIGDTSLIMAAIFCLVVIPAIMYLFLLVAKLSKH